MDPPVAEMNWAVYLGAEQLLGEKATRRHIIETIQSINRDVALTTCGRVLTAVAYDLKHDLRDEQNPLIEWLPGEARNRLRERQTELGTRIRLFHPLQLLSFVHMAARHADPRGGLDLSTEEGKVRWAVAAIQINDQLSKGAFQGALPQPRRALALFTEEVTGWELANPPNPNRSLARLWYLLKDLPDQQPEARASAQRMVQRFQDYFDLSFETVFALTAFLIYWWHSRASEIPQNVDATLLSRREWIRNMSTSRADFDKYIRKFGMAVEDICGAFDALKAGRSFREIRPFRRRPLLMIGDDLVAILCPQLMTEKGGIDLFWSLTQEPGGGKEQRLWTDDFGELYEAYVTAIVDGLGDRVGGRYVSNVRWELGRQVGGQIDGLIHYGRVLVVLEVKGSFLREGVKAGGGVPDVEAELERKFVVGELGGQGRSRKGVRQLVHAIKWLHAQRRAGQRVADIDLSQIEIILPGLVVADRSLRFPGLGLWLTFRMREMLGASLPWRVGALVLLGTEDLEAIEARVFSDNTTLGELLRQYDFRCPDGQYALWQTLQPRAERHPRLDPVMEKWIGEQRLLHD